MTTNAARQNTDHLRRLEEMRATYDRLRTERIRAESEVERLAGELERAKENARTRNAELVTEFESLILGIEARLQALGGGR
jgi:predicted  nucleic acid-binding Zn-ribbon protein